MQNKFIAILILLIVTSGNQAANAQNSNSTPASGSDFLVAHAFADRNVFYSVADSGEYKPITWGLDLAWLSRDNVRRGIAYMGKERVDVIRSSFTPTSPLVNGELQTEELNRLNERLSIIDLCGPETKVVLNCDHPSVDPWFKGNAEHWMQLIEVTARLHEEHGRTVIGVSPFNEPDYVYTGQGTMGDFYNIASLLKENPYFNNIRISGGNTLSCDEALPWYNQLKSKLDEGNTHQLAGSFDSYAEFYQTVRANGDHATNDELHNVMEAMVGVEYGLQTGIWWGTAEYARSEFVKDSDGRRLAYAEHRDNWTAASVYRSPEGKVQAFGGTSERQAVTTSYHFVSRDRDVYYNGQGPQREYIMELPGGTGYQQGQSNAERVVNITWGDDIQPVIDGSYLIVNRNSGKVLELAGGSTGNAVIIQQNTSNGANYQKWSVKPVAPKIGGDFSYFSITSEHSKKAMDVYNWSLDNGGEIRTWDVTNGANQQYYLEYAEDGWFYIRSRHSALCLDIYNSSTANGTKVIQWGKNDGKNQQWRFLPVDAPVEFDAPTAPANLVATGNAESIRLDWSASPESDVAGYTILRARATGGPYSTIARGVTTTSYVDNNPTEGGQFFYVVRAVDHSLNRSAYSNEASAEANGENGLVLCYKFEGNLLDSSVNLNHSVAYDTVGFGEGIVGRQALLLDNDKSFLQLPATLANQQELTVATWVNWNNSASWSRIFDFGNDEDHYLYLTPRMRFAIKNGGSEQRLDADALPKGEWVHVAVTLGTSVCRLYVNGEIADESSEITIRPMDLKPVLNYIGRAQVPVSLFNGSIDDFRVYNYALSPDEVATLADPTTSVSRLADAKSSLHFWPVPAHDVLEVNYASGIRNSLSTLNLLNTNGQVVLSKTLDQSTQTTLNVAHLPSGMYLVKLMNNGEIITKKLLVEH